MDQKSVSFLRKKPGTVMVHSGYMATALTTRRGTSPQPTAGEIWRPSGLLRPTQWVHGFARSRNRLL